MARFLTRVELHKKENRTVTAEDYELLHKEMKAKGFLTTIKSSEPKTYKLPTAEYHRESLLDKAAILADAKEAAQKVVVSSQNVRSFAILVVKYEEATWVGLDEINISVQRN